MHTRVDNICHRSNLQAAATGANSSLSLHPCGVLAASRAKVADMLANTALNFILGATGKVTL
jgi:hypothetical protein